MIFPLTHIREIISYTCNTIALFCIIWSFTFSSVNFCGFEQSESHSVVSNSVTPWTIQSMEFSRPECWSGYPIPSPGDLPNPGIKPRSSELQANYLPAELQGSPRILEWVAFPFSSGSSWPRNQTGVSCIAGRFFTNWAIREVRIYHSVCKTES